MNDAPTDKSDNQNNALINFTIKDIFGLKSAYPALTKSIDRLVDAVQKGTGTLMQAPNKALIARAERYAVAQQTKGQIDILELYLAKANELGISSNTGQLNRMLSRMLQEDIEKQIKREQVAAKAIELFSESAGNDKSPSDDEPIDKDWLHLFWECAERKDHEELQDIFARILSREAIQPGAIDPAALHVLSILTPDQARMIQRVLSIAIYVEDDDDYFIVEAPLGEGGMIEDAPDWFDFGLSNEDFLNAEQLGILVRTISVLFDDEENELDILIGTRRGKLVLPKLDAGKEIACKPLSHIAKSLRQVIPLQDNQKYVADLSRFFKEYGFELEVDNN